MFFGFNRRQLGLKELPAPIVDQAQAAAQRCQSPISIISPQHQAVLAAAGQHPVGLFEVFGHQIVDHCADITFFASQGHRILVAKEPGCIEASHQPLGGGLFIARGAIELTRRKQAADAFALQGGPELGGRQVVVFDGIGRAQHHTVLQPRQGSQQAELQPFGQACGKALHVDLGGVAAFGFQKYLVTVLIGKAHDLVFN